jgi:hypothetical protein
MPRVFPQRGQIAESRLLSFACAWEFLLVNFLFTLAPRVNLRMLLESVFIII